MKQILRGILVQIIPGFIRYGVWKLIASRRDRILKSEISRPQNYKRGPLIVSRFGRANFGIGGAGRATVLALQSAGLQVIEQPLEELLHHGGVKRAKLSAKLGGVWLIHANPPEALIALTNVTAEERLERYIIGFWAWELTSAPQSWIEATQHFDEVWVPSAFVAASLEGAKCPIKIVPHFIKCPERTKSASSKTDDLNSCSFLSISDFQSTERRKNTLGVIEAYKSAFPIPSPQIRLVLKVGNPHTEPAAWAQLQSLKRSDIMIITDTLSEDELEKIFKECSVLVSLHRSEGYGLVMAEAFVHQKPVIATGWSGNMEFTNDANSILVPFELISINEDASRYGQYRQKWAEPDLLFASAAMQRLSKDPELRKRLGANGRQTIEQSNARLISQLHEGSFNRLLDQVVLEVQSTLEG